MRFLSPILIAFVGFFLFINKAFSARPLATEDAYTLEKYHYELEIGATYSKDIPEHHSDEEEFKEVSKERTIELAVKYGLLENLDIGFVFPYSYRKQNQERIDGCGDIELNTKWRIFSEENFAFSYSLKVNLKTQSANEDKGLGSGQNEIKVINLFSRDLDKIIFHLNLGYNFLSKRKGQDDTFWGAFAWEAPILKDKLNLCVEVNAETTFKKDFDESKVSAGLGFNYALNPGLIFDSGMRWGISESANDYEITSGLTFRF